MNLRYSNQLRFTGNWFIDLGILGFANLMEEVYGWDLEKLKDLLEKNYERCVYVYFPLGYLFYHSKIREFYKKDKELRNKISDEINKLRENVKKKENLESQFKKEANKKKKEKIKKKIEKSSQKIDETKEKIERIERELLELRKNLQKSKNSFVNSVLKLPDEPEINDKILNQLIPDFNLYLPEDHRNFFLYNPKKNLPLSFRYLNLLLKEKYEGLKNFTSTQSKKKAKEGLTYEIYPDSTINPFLFSPGEFSNITYSKLLSVQEIKDSLKINLPIYLTLLSFFHAFQFVGNERIAFYTNNLKLAYDLNKRFKLLIERRGNQSLFAIMWKAIIDQLVETKARLNLENIYFVRFTGIENLKLKDVEFIGISKLQAEILIDDRIRDALNTYIQVSEKGNKSSLWLLEEFLKNKPLLPIFYRTLRLFFGDKIKNFPSTAMIYAAAVDKALSELNRGKGESLFSDDFFSRHKSVVEEIKENIRTYFGLKSKISELFSDSQNQKEKDSLAYQLFTKVRKNHKYGFVNEVLKALNSLDEKRKIDFVVSHLFNNILQNDTSWQSDAVPIIAGLVSKGGVEDEY